MVSTVAATTPTSSPPRTSELTLAACPTLFTPLQMHQRELLRLGLNGWAGWLRDHLMSIQKLVENYQTSMVVAMAHLRYIKNVTFHDCETIQLVTRASCIKGGVLLEMPSSILADNQEVAQVKISLRPVTITDQVSLGAKPGRLPAEVINLFSEEEISKNLERPVQKLTKQIEEQKQGELIAEGRYPFQLHRYALDFADQWAFMEAAAYINASREKLVLGQGSKQPALKVGFSHPLQQIDIELHKPYFLLDEGVVDTKVYLWQHRVVFIHRLLGYGTGVEESYATAIEQFDQ
ncbi:hypothetical protein [Microcystis aeruginosa]|uniref:hypothetical protein n=1 Tax=Microcystis aeruginosa TaxID=1126 RepID=UPI0011EAABBE|nr:hypothetical protein [Microcystis aeruginosa]TYT72780.1 hypothetical protein FXO09_01740 [Microcystis aeruginosa KLA2]